MSHLAARGYARTYQSQSVLSASAGQLILMLYDGALKFMGNAKDALELPERAPRRIEIINTNILKAQNIVAELQACLNFEAGGDHAANLNRLYDYYLRRLLEANLKKQLEPLLEVERLVRTLRDGWAEMLRNQEAPISQGIRGVA